MANRAAGKGYENEAFYENTKFHFLGVENIHTMRASLQKLIEGKIWENVIFDLKSSKKNYLHGFYQEQNF